MAMRYGHRICSHVRIKSLLAVPTSQRGRSYCSGSPFPVPVVTASSKFIGASTIAMWSAVFYCYNGFGCRSKVEDWRAEMKVQQRLKRLNREKLLSEKAYFQMLDRKKFKSEDAYLEMLERVEFEPEYAYLEMLEREANVLKEKLLERDIGLMDAKIYQREVAALKEVLQETRLAKENNTPRQP